MIPVHREQNTLGCISEHGSTLRDITCSVQKTSTETRRNKADMGLCVPIITERNVVVSILQVPAFPNE